MKTSLSTLISTACAGCQESPIQIRASSELDKKLSVRNKHLNQIEKMRHFQRGHVPIHSIFRHRIHDHLDCGGVRMTARRRMTLSFLSMFQPTNPLPSFCISQEVASTLHLQHSTQQIDEALSQPVITTAEVIEQCPVIFLPDLRSLEIENFLGHPTSLRFRILKCKTISFQSALFHS